MFSTSPSLYVVEPGFKPGVSGFRAQGQWEQLVPVLPSISTKQGLTADNGSHQLWSGQGTRIRQHSQAGIELWSQQALDSPDA